MWHTQQLGKEENITRQSASDEMRKMSLEYNQMFRRVMFPAIGMLIGGFLASTGRRKGNSQPAGGAYFLPGAGKKSAHP
jgi:hypothetical protein